MVSLFVGSYKYCYDSLWQPLSTTNMQQNMPITCHKGYLTVSGMMVTFVSVS